MTLPAIDVETYLTERLNDQITYYEKAAARSKQMHQRLQTAIIVFSVVVPVVVSRPPGWAGQYQPLVVVLALLLPVMTGLANFRKYGESWVSYRTAVELLKNEKYLFLTGSGRYRNNPNAVQDLVETVESLLSAEHNKFRSFFSEVRQSTPGGKGRGQAPAAAADQPAEAPDAAGGAPLGHLAQ